MRKSIKSNISLGVAACCLAAISAAAYAAPNRKVVAPFNDAQNSVTAGGTCASPTAFTAVPFSDSGTTVGATDVISSVPSACSQWGTTAGPEAIYSFVAGAAANLTFSVTPGNGDYDAMAYIVSTCNSAASCVVGADDGYAGAAETFTASALTAGTTYYLHIDSYYSASGAYPAYAAGPYTLSVSGTLPVSLQEFQID